MLEKYVVLGSLMEMKEEKRASFGVKTEERMFH